MQQKILFFSLLFFLIIQLFLFAENEKQTIIILPFTNTGKKHGYLHEDLFMSYFYVYFKRLPNFYVIHPIEIINFRTGNVYTTDDLYDLDVIYVIAEKFGSDLILGGEFKVENELLKVNLDIYGKRKPKIKRNYTLKIEDDGYETVHTIVRETTGTLAHYNPDTACLIINTEHPCTLYIDDIPFGRTPRRFNLPAGDYSIKVVYEDANFKKAIFQKQTVLRKGELYDLGQGTIKVLATLHFNINVKADVFYDNKKIGTTDTDFKIPVANSYVIDLVYIDKNNEKQIERRIISTETGEDILIEYEFKNRIKMNSGDLPFSGKLDTEIYTLPHTFENLEPGTYRVQMLLEDEEWNKNWIILDKKVTLNIAETTIIDKSDFIYRKYWRLCFIPGAAQFYNFQKKKATIILTLTGISLAGGITSYFLMENNVKIVNKYNVYRMITWSGTGLFCCVYIYSCIDGIITMGHLYKLIYPD